MEKVAKSLLHSQRYRPIWFLSILLISLSLLTRITLVIYSKDQIDTLQNLFGIFPIGFFYDLINASYVLLPPLLYFSFASEQFLKNRKGQYLTSVLVFLFSFILLLNGTAEYYFWDEFNARFNFIAVDYLVYTSEVIGNIRQSYPIEGILFTLILLSFLLSYLGNLWIFRKSEIILALTLRKKVALVALLLPTLFYFTLDNRLHNFSDNNFANELAGNGMYELFAAYRNNELNYEQFYPHIEDEVAIDLVNRLFTSTSSKSGQDRYSIEHLITNDSTPKNLNVVLISVESLSAEFLNHFGSTKNITPFLDSLAEHSLLFTNLYATGTRTVRGLEALSLAIPPTPGQSIVRRPNNEHLFSLATVFNEKGYESKFIYGGYGYFDNMNYFFENNGYTVVDRTSLQDSEINYENIWGVADENLFTLALREIDKTTSLNKPSFTHIMTTSNHRPYTYPEGRVDIPSHTSRAGAVKYTDYTLDKFIKEASKKKWYTNTLFVITADHCASSAGKTQLPIEKYKIPLLIFSPYLISKKVEDRLMSQIDIAPTLLGLLNFSYKSKFFGYDIFKVKPGNERAFISTYQALGYIKKDSLVVMLPKKTPTVWLLDDHNKITTKLSLPLNDKYMVLKEAISWYQTASYEFKHGKLKSTE